MAIDLFELALWFGLVLAFLGILATLGPIWKRKKVPLLFFACAFLCLALTYLWFYRRVDVFYGRSAARGDSYALYRLGSARLYYGQGSFFSPKSAYEMLLAAAKKGYVPAQLKLAGRHFNGVAMPRDLEQASHWASIAASAGSEDGALMVHCLTSDGSIPDSCHSLFSKWAYK